MIPNAVGLHFGDERIFGRGHPIGKSGEFIGGLRRIGFAEEARCGGFAGAGIFHFTGGGEENNLFAFKFVPVVVVAAAVFQDFVFHTREDALPIVVIILAPAVERMVVALRALDASAEEKLSGSFGTFDGGAGGAIKIGRRIFVGAAAGGDDFAGELVERFVIGDALLDPAVKEFEPFAIENAFFGAEEIHPFQRPEFGEAPIFEKLIDEAGAFAGSLFERE